MRCIDLRSDTVTWPTDSMREAMAKAAVGDDGYGDDPTMRELEDLGASIVGKQAALFVPSGTFGNQLALFSHCPRGSEVILGDDCHIVAHEAGASAVIAGVQLRTVSTSSGALSAESVTDRLRDPRDMHVPQTSLVCVENAHSNGRAFPLDAMRSVSKASRDHGIPVHLDGARIFNAAAALDVDASEIAACADSVMFCLSKGLCAPVGSLLAGSAEFISLARRKRKIMGGQLRQAGVLAACGLIALSDMRTRLQEDNRNARMLAQSLSSIPNVVVEFDRLDINMVFFRLLSSGSPGDREPDAEGIISRLKEKGILANPPTQGLWRLVTHYWIKSDMIGGIAQAFRSSLLSS